MSKLILYGANFSPPVRATLLTLNALDIPFEYTIVDLSTGEHLSDEFTKHNPQHTVPVLDDNGTWIWDSHAICTYLVDKYGKSDELYPKDLAKRAVVNQRLHFDSGILFPSLSNVVLPMLRMKITVVPKEKTDRIIDGYNFVEKFLIEHHYPAGDKLTLADFSCVATLTSLTAIVPLDAKKYPNILAWLERISKLPYYEEANGKGVKQLIEFVRSGLTQVEL